MNRQFPTFSLGDGSASCFEVDKKIIVSRYYVQGTVTRKRAISAWQMALARPSQTEGEKRDQLRRFSSLALGVDLQ